MEAAVVMEEMEIEARGHAAQHGDDMPRVILTRRRVIGFALFVLAIVAFLYFVLPKLAGVGKTLHRLERGNTWWILAGVAFEGCSFGGHIVLFRTVFVRGWSRIGWRESYQITMAGLAATRLFAAAGAGGGALTAGAGRRPGLGARAVGCRVGGVLGLLYLGFLGPLL